MVIDTSALIAILCNEAERAAFIDKIEADAVRLLSVVSLVETALVIERRFGEPGGHYLDLFIHKAAIELVAVDVNQAEIARYASRCFGKGRHPAGLNFGDCFAYALARVSGEALLFKGGDFIQADITPS